MPQTALKAIMFADIVGYTSMMQRDRVAAMTAVKAYEEALKNHLSDHRGELLQTYGDGSLSIFDSASDAIDCAWALQKTASGKIPLKIGIHLGEITRDGDHTFGDGINVCSRIESLGIEGAILFSKNIQKEIANRSDLHFDSLGSFQFKNVAEAMEVFALANPPAVIPNRKDLGGKLAATSSSRPWIAGLIVLVMATLGGYWWWSQDTPASTDLKDKRMAVIPFTDQSGTSELPSFGFLLADWLSSRLTSIDGTIVISPENIQTQIREARQGGDNPLAFGAELQKLTGVDILIEGSYYLVEDTLIIHAKILDILENQMVKSFEVRGESSGNLALLESLGQQILGYWAVKEYEYLAQKPPTYESYRLFEEGKDLGLTDPQESIRKLTLAAEADPNFLDPLFALHGMYNKEGMVQQRDEVFARITSKKPIFTRADQLLYSQFVEIRSSNWLRAAQLGEQMFSMDPSNVIAALRSFELYLYVNYPERALKLWEQIDPRFLTSDEITLNWKPVGRAFAFSLLKSHDQVIEIAQGYELPKMPDALAVIHMHALIRKGEMEELGKAIDKYQELGLFSTSGEITPFSIILTYICDVLYLSDYQAELTLYLNELRELMDLRKEADPAFYRTQGTIAFYEGDFQAALNSWQRERLENQSWPGWLRKELDAEHISRIGYCAVMIGDSSTVRECREKLAVKADEEKELAAIHHYYASRLYAAEGEPDKACQSLERAIDAGFTFFKPQVFLQDPFLKSLNGLKRFENLVAVKG